MLDSSNLFNISYFCKYKVHHPSRLYIMTRYLFFFSLLLFYVSLHAQRHEIGPFAGTSYYLGDINPKKHFAQNSYGIGLLYRYNLNPHWSIRANLYYGRIQASDSIIRFNPKRNLHFRSNLTEIAAGMELNFFQYKTGDKKRKFSPFMFASIGYVHFNPQAELNGIWYDLQPLGTEGQGTSAYPDRNPYSLGSYVIPFGIGFKFSAGKSICISAEWGLRKTFTDYIDDISTTYPDPLILAAENSPLAAQLSDRTIYGQDEDPTLNVGKQRGDPSTNDWYSFAGLAISFKIPTKKPDCPGMQKRTRKYKDYKYD